MGLKVDYEQIKKESKLYENIDTMLKLDDGSVIGFENLDPKIKPLFDKIYERYLLNRAIVAYENKKDKDPEKEEKLQKRLEENNAYFTDLTDEDKKTFQGIFESADDNLGKSAEWQNYFMVYTDLKGMAFHNKLNSYFLQAPEKKARIKNFEDAKNELKKVENKWPYDAAMTISYYQKAEKKENEYKKDLEKLENSRKKEVDGVRALQKEVSDAEDRLKKYPEQLESIKREKRKLLNTLASYNKLKTKAETEYAATLQEIDNDKKELENRIQDRKEAAKQYFDKKDDLYDLAERFEDQNLKDNIKARKNRDFIIDVRDEIQKLKENPEINLSECIYGKEDGTIIEKYQVKSWIEIYTSLKLESKELKAKHLAAQEQVSEEMEADVAENESSEKEDIEFVEGETNYEKLLTDLDEMLDKVDDVFWEEIGNTAEKLTGEVAEVYKKTEEDLDNLDKVWDEKNAAVAEQKKKVDEAPAKMEEAKKTFDENMEEAYDQFNPNPKTGKGFFSDYSFAFEGDYKTFPEQVDRIVKEKVDRDIQRKEADGPRLEEKLKEAKTNYEQARKALVDGREKYSQEWTALKDKITEAEYDTKKYKEGYELLKPAADNFARVYKETFKEMPEQEHYDMESLIKQQAAEWLKVEGLHSGNHKNSIEYDRMIAAVKMVANYNTSLQHHDFDKFKGMVLPVSFEDTVAFMKDQAEKYQKAKARQWRPFPSRMRTHRKNVAKFLIGFADKAQKGIAAEKEAVSFDQYILTEGKSQGLDLSSDNFIRKIKEDEQIEHPNEKKQSENMQDMENEATQEEPAKEEITQEEPAKEEITQEEPVKENPKPEAQGNQRTEIKTVDTLRKFKEILDIKENFVSSLSRWERTREDNVKFIKTLEKNLQEKRETLATLEYKDALQEEIEKDETYLKETKKDYAKEERKLKKQILIDAKILADNPIYPKLKEVTDKFQKYMEEHDEYYEYAYEDVPTELKEIIPLKYLSEELGMGQMKNLRNIGIVDIDQNICQLSYTDYEKANKILQMAELEKEKKNEMTKENVETKKNEIENPEMEDEGMGMH